MPTALLASSCYQSVWDLPNQSNRSIAGDWFQPRGCPSTGGDLGFTQIWPSQESWVCKWISPCSAWHFLQEISMFSEILPQPGFLFCRRLEKAHTSSLGHTCGAMALEEDLVKHTEWPTMGFSSTLAPWFGYFLCLPFLLPLKATRI